MSRKAWIIFIAVCVILFGGLVALSIKNRVNVADVNAAKIQPAAEDSGGVADHVYGNADSPVVLIEYGDYQCPGCGNAYQPVKELAEKYKDQIAFVFRNFPLTNIHPNALAAASAAEAAGLQGKYWEMHDILYETQSDWSNLSTGERTSFFNSYAKELGLDVEQFKTDMLSDEVSKKIKFDQALGKKLGVTATPTFYVGADKIDEYALDGKLVSSSTQGASPVWASAEDLEKLIILPALKEHGIEPPKE